MPSTQYGTLVIVVLGVLFLIYALGPWNWEFVPFKWAGVKVRFDRILGLEEGEENVDQMSDEELWALCRSAGPVHIWVPWERVIKIPLADQIEDIPIPELHTAAVGDTPAVEVQVTLPVVIRYKNPIRIIVSVPDRDPYDEVRAFIIGEVSAIIGEMPYTSLLEESGPRKLQTGVERALNKNKLFRRWGLEVVEIGVPDINLPKEVREASNTRVKADAAAYARTRAAQAEAEAAVAQAKGEAEALKGQIGELGPESARWWVEQRTRQNMAEKGAFRTVINVGLEQLGRLLGGGRND